MGVLAGRVLERQERKFCFPPIHCGMGVRHRRGIHSPLLALTVYLWLSGSTEDAFAQIQGERALRTAAPCLRANAMVDQAVAAGTGGDLNKAHQLLQAAVEQCPGHAHALGNLGYLNALMGNRAASRHQLEEALLADPTLMEPWVNLGNIIKDLNEEALGFEGASDSKETWRRVWRFYRTALRLNRHQTDITANVAGLHAMERDWEYAAHMATRSLDIEYTEEAFCTLMKSVDNICDWDNPHRDERRLDTVLTNNIAAALAHPGEFHRHKLCYNAGTAALISDLPASIVLGLARAEMAITEANVSATQRVRHSFGSLRLPHDRRLHLAYVSGHFLNHPMMQMMQGMFRGHDARRFHVDCYSTTRSDESALRRDAEKSCHAFHLVAGMGDADVAAAINGNGVHIFIALYGFLDKSRNAIAAFTPAPLQINHRWCSTTGAAHIDLHVTDRVTTPPEMRGAFSEALAFMPHSYLVNDHRHSYLAARKQALSEFNDGHSQDGQAGHHGLQAGGEVLLASLNNLYKLDRAVFDSWMQVLRRVPAARLVLMTGKEGPRVNARLARRAQHKYHIRPERLTRVGPLSKEAHIARHGRFVLFLDTWKVASHSTAVDALWANVPVLVLPQEKMQARVSAGLVAVLGMPELLARSVEDYVHLAVRLARLGPARQRRLRGRLAARVEASALFDTARWVRNVERMHRLMWDVLVATGKQQTLHIIVNAAL